MNYERNQVSDSTFYFVIIILLLISYFPAFTGDYIGDDVGRLAALQGSVRLLEMLSGSLGDRPVLVISIWVDRYVLNLSPGMMRIETLLFFGFIALLMRKIVNELDQRLSLGVNPAWRDSIILLYSIHPLHTQGLTHIVQRGIVYSSLGGLLATYLLIKNNFKWRSLGWRLALLVWMLALLAKPNIAFLPLFWVILAFKLHIERNNILALVGFFFMLLIPVLNYKIGEFNVQDLGETTPLNYFATQAKALLIYAKLIILPIDLKFNHDVGVPMGKLWWPGLILWPAYLLIVALWVQLAKHWTIGIFILGALLAFTPESSIFPIMHPIFEHRTLFPMVFMAISAILMLRDRKTTKRHIAALAMLVILSVTLSLHRNQQSQRFSVWAERELGNTCYLDYMQLQLLERLLDGGYFLEARRGLDRLKLCDDKKNNLFCFEALYNFSAEPGHSPGALNELKTCVHSELNLKKWTRAAINSLVVKKISKILPADRNCLLEDFLSAQLRSFKESRKDYATEINFYATVAEGCLKESVTKAYPDTRFQVLKIRTIKRYHFGVNDDKLASDLAKAPQTPDYDYLRTLLESAPKL